jgi:hypothetical protein
MCGSRTHVLVVRWNLLPSLAKMMLGFIAIVSMVAMLLRLGLRVSDGYTSRATTTPATTATTETLFQPEPLLRQWRIRDTVSLAFVILCGYTVLVFDTDNLTLQVVPIRAWQYQPRRALEEDDFPWPSTPIHLRNSASTDRDPRPPLPPSKKEFHDSTTLSRTTGRIVSPPPEATVENNTTVPLVMVALASSILVCAGALYLSDLRDRCLGYYSYYYHHNHNTCPPHRRIDDADEAHLQHAWYGPYGYYWAQSHPWRSVSLFEGNGGVPAVPHSFTASTQQEQQPDSENVRRKPPPSSPPSPASPVSTSTASVNLDLARVDSDQCLMLSTNTIELVDADRVFADLDLASLVDSEAYLEAMSDYYMSDYDEMGRSQPDMLSLADCDDIPAYSAHIVNRRHSSGRRTRIDHAVDDVMSSDSDSDMSDDNESGWTSVLGLSDESSTCGHDDIYLKSFSSSLSGAPSADESGLQSSNDDGSKPDSGGPKECRDEEDGSLDRSPDIPLEPLRQCASRRVTESSSHPEGFQDDVTIQRKLSSPMEVLLKSQGHQEARNIHEPMEEATEIDDSLCEDCARGTSLEHKSVVGAPPKVAAKHKSAMDRACHLFRWTSSAYRKRYMDGDELVHCHSLPESKSLSSLSRELWKNDFVKSNVDGFETGSDGSILLPG